MGLTVLEGIALLVAWIMTGNELCIGLVNARLKRMEDRVRFEATRTLAGRFGAIMPFWYAATLLLSSAVAYGLRGAGAAVLADISTALWLVSILYTVTALVPINSRIAAADWETRPTDWTQARQTWDTRHIIRITLLVTAFGCLVSACLLAGT